MFAVEGLTVVGLLATMVSRWIHPLQHRPHLIYQMSGRYDLRQLSTKELRAHRVAQRVNLIAANPMDEDNWSWGKMPYDRDHPTPTLFPRLQDYGLSAADPSGSGLEDIEDADEVEPNMVACAGDAA
ncbi:hypothetical protein D1007_27251 [Hordeum vulgare]|nr:hypothetical protein D1007_27251 [Hordeum vulgare]